MRIGEFAESNNLNIDTVRYYVDLNLIHPIRKGKYFYFEEEQQEELNKLLYLKKLRFTLEEISKIVKAQGFGKIKTPVESRIYEDMLLRKRHDLSIEVSELSAVLNEIDTEVEKLREKHDDAYKECGIAFNNLGLLCCPKCGRDIEISDGTLKGNGIFDGESLCGCGYKLSVNQGIIVTKHSQENILEPYKDDQNYIDDFAVETPKTFTDLMINTSKEIVRLLLGKELSDKVLLFMKAGIGVLGAELLEHSRDIKLILLVDDDINKLRIAKKTIESNFPGSNVIYICSELHDLPLRKKSADIAIDFLATFINGFVYPYNIYDYVIPILKERSSIIGLYMYFKRFTMLSRLPEAHRRLFDGRTIPQSIKGYRFVEASEYEENFLSEGDNINDFFQKGDIVHSRIMVFERRD